MSNHDKAVARLASCCAMGTFELLKQTEVYLLEDLLREARAGDLLGWVREHLDFAKKELKTERGEPC